MRFLILTFLLALSASAAMPTTSNTNQFGTNAPLSIMSDATVTNLHVAGTIKDTNGFSRFRLLPNQTAVNFTNGQRGFSLSEGVNGATEIFALDVGGTARLMASGFSNSFNLYDPNGPTLVAAASNGVFYVFSLTSAGTITAPNFFAPNGGQFVGGIALITNYISIQNQANATFLYTDSDGTIQKSSAAIPTLSGNNTFTGSNRFNLPIGINIAPIPSISLYGDNSSTADDTHGVKFVRIVTLDRNLGDQSSSGYFASHLKLNGFASTGDYFPLYGAILFQQTGTVANATGVKSYMTMENTSQVNVTNVFGFKSTVDNASTNGGSYSNAWGYYVSFTGAGTNGNQVGFEALNNTVVSTGDTIGFKSSMNAGNRKYGFWASGTASNIFAGDTYFGAVYLSGVGYLANGSAALPSLALVNDPDTGFYRANTDAIGFSTAGVGKWQINSAGHILAITDNAYDIGASAATRPRNIYAAGTVTIGGDATIAASGELTFTGEGRIGFSTDGVVYLRNSGATALATLNIKTLNATNDIGTLLITSTNGFSSSPAIKTPGPVTVGASPFSFTNTTGVNLECYFEGAAAYAVSKNGAGVYGSIAGDAYFVLQPANVCVITYTVAPTFFTNAW